MIVTRLALLMIPLGLAACNAAPAPGFAGERSVFSNPYVQPVIDQRGIGPGCEVDAEPGSLCTSGGAIYPGRGHFALAPNGELVRLNRAERQLLRDRADALEAQGDVFESLANGTQLPPGSPAWPQRGSSATPEQRQTP